MTNIFGCDHDHCRTAFCPYCGARVNPDGMVLRDEAIGRVDANTDGAWRDNAIEAARRACVERAFITSDDVWERMSKEDQTRDPRAMGPIMMKAHKLKLCEPTGDHVKSRYHKCHCRPKRIWRSLICTNGTLFPQ